MAALVQLFTTTPYLHDSHHHRSFLPPTSFLAPTSTTNSIRYTTRLKKTDSLSSSSAIVAVPPRPPRLRVSCMATQRRVNMVAKQIRRELSNMLLTDKVLRYAVLPEAAFGADRYISTLTTISDVEVSGDLQIVKVYVSVFGDERGKEVAIAGLKSKTKYVRKELGKRMKLRLTPEIRFFEDESIERGSRVIAILDKLKAERGSDGEDAEEFSSDENGDWDKDDEGDIK